MRKEFLGKRINSNNYKKVYNEYFDYFLNVEGKKDSYNTWTAAQLLKAARMYSKYQISKEQKHLRAYLKGSPTYRFKGKVFPVLQSQENGPQFLSELGLGEEE